MTQDELDFLLWLTAHPLYNRRHPRNLSYGQWTFSKWHFFVTRRQLWLLLLLVPHYRIGGDTSSQTELSPCNMCSLTGLCWKVQTLFCDKFFFFYLSFLFLCGLLKTFREQSERVDINKNQSESLNIPEMIKIKRDSALCLLLMELFQTNKVCQASTGQ